MPARGVAYKVHVPGVCLAVDGLEGGARAQTRAGR
jgi:hypothetical protein